MLHGPGGLSIGRMRDAPRGWPGLPHHAHQLVTRDVGHVEIRDEDIYGHALENPERLGTRLRGVELPTRLEGTQRAVEAPKHESIVVHDQDYERATVLVGE